MIYRGVNIKLITFFLLTFLLQSLILPSYANTSNFNVSEVGQHSESKISKSGIDKSNSDQIVTVVKLNSGKLAVIKESVVGSVNERIELLRNRSGILTSARTVPLYALGSPDPARNQQWHLNRLDVEKIPVKNPNSSIKVAVLDTGVMANHPDFTGLIVDGYDVYGKNLEGRDPNGHGTHVAGIIAALSDNGVAGRGVFPGVKIMPVRVLDETGYGDDADVAKGVIWAVENGAKVLNLSLGGVDYSEALRESISYATTKGVLVVTAAGNSYLEGNPVIYPAAYSGSYAVGATMPGDTRAPFSTTGEYVDIAAPGFAITSTWNQGSIATMSGTSMAAPIVSGVAALLMINFPNLTSLEIENLINKSALDIGEKGRDSQFGNGMVDPLYAITGTRSAPSAMPQMPLLPEFKLPNLPIPVIKLPDLPSYPKLLPPSLDKLPELPQKPNFGVAPSSLLQPLLQILPGSMDPNSLIKLRVWYPGNGGKIYQVKKQNTSGDKSIIVATGTLDSRGSATIELKINIDSSFYATIDNIDTKEILVNISNISEHYAKIESNKIVFFVKVISDNENLIVEYFDNGKWVQVKRVKFESKSIKVSILSKKGVYRYYLESESQNKHTKLI